jgi:NAD(P)-dependent dehydrogenase (short-subunit alcohol dehydrogenase family)
MTAPVHSVAGKVSLVTGASSGAGAEIAKELGRRGATVAVHCRASMADAASVVSHIVASGGCAAAFSTDLSLSNAPFDLATRVEEQLGPVQILINNAGPFTDTPFRSLSPADWEYVMAVNLRAPYLLAQRLGAGMEGLGWGRIVNISATSAYVRSHSAYGLAKAALLHLSESLALEFAPHVTVNAIVPGQIASLRTDTMPSYKAAVIDDTPMRRLVTEQEVAAMVAMLCAPEFDFVTGRAIVMDGGRSLPRVPRIGPELPGSS